MFLQMKCALSRKDIPLAHSTIQKIQPLAPEKAMASKHCIKRLPLVLFLAGSSALADNTSHPVPSTLAPRGEMLYTTHCNDCHTREVHWRARKLVTNFQQLHTEVKRWKDHVAKEWTEEEVREVTRHLNDTLYHFDARPPSRK